MKTVNNMPGLAALIALALALPASAEQSNTARNKELAGMQTVAARTVNASRTLATAQNREGASAASAQQNALGTNPNNLPYITYDGAGSTSPCNDEQLGG
jgi:hypothetical protein